MRIILAALVLAASACGSAETPQASAPLGVKLTGRVVDAAHVLAPADERRLDKELGELEQSTTDQLVVVTLPSLEGKSIEEVGLALGRGWGVGREDVDNGVLLIVAPNERKVRVEVGYGLEGLLTDARAAEAVQIMLPHFREGEIAAGVRAGVSAISGVLRSDIRRPQYRSEERRRAA